MSGHVQEAGSDGIEQIEGSTDEENSNVAVYGGSSSIHASDELLRDPYVQTLLKRVADLEARGGTSNPLSTAPVLQSGGGLQQQPPKSADAKRDFHETVSSVIAQRAQPVA